MPAFKPSVLEGQSAYSVVSHKKSRQRSRCFDVVVGLWFIVDFTKRSNIRFRIFSLSKYSFFKSLKISLFKVDVSPWSPVEEFNMKPTAVADEMFPEGAGTYVDAEEGGGSVGLLMDLTAVNEKAVHDGFFNDFEDLFDDEDIS